MLKVKFTCPECKEEIKGYFSEYEEPSQGGNAILIKISITGVCDISDVVIECPKCEAYISLYD